MDKSVDCKPILNLERKEAIKWLRENVYFCYICPLHDKRDFYGCRHCEHANIKQRSLCLKEIKKYLKQFS